MKIQPAQARSTVSDEPGGLRIIMPVKRNWFLILFTGFWLCGWAVAESVVPVVLYQQVRAGTLGLESLFLLAWLGCWTVGGGFAIYAWLWNMAGKEVVFLNGMSLIVRREIYGFGRSKEFDLAHLRDLRCSPQGYGPWNASSNGWGISGGNIAFDYGARTYRFGTGLDEAEAKHIVKAIKQRVTIPGESGRESHP